MAWTWILVCMHCYLDLEDMTLSQGHNKPLGHGQQLRIILSRFNMAVWSYGPDTYFLVYMHFDLGDMTLVQGHDTPLGHGQYLCETLSRSSMAVRSYGPDTDFEYEYTVTLTLKIWSWPKTMTHPWMTIVWNVIQIHMALMTFGLDTDFGYVCIVTLTLVQGHDTPLGHGQQLCEILS